MFSLSARDLAIDLGTANTLIYEQGKGIVLNEPSMIALRVHGSRKEPVAYGADAKAMQGRTPEDVKVIRPVRTGVIADFDAASMMLMHYLERVRKNNKGLFKPRIVIGVPSGITEVEKRAIRNAVDNDARDVRLIDEAMAAAIGSSLPITESAASLIVDIGGGTTDVAVISLKRVVYAVSVRQGGDTMDEAIINYIRRKHHLLIGETTAEFVKKTVGSAHEEHDQLEIEVRGRNLATGAPGAQIVTAGEIREAIEEVVSALIASIRQAFEHTPPELSGDLLSTGVWLAGGGSLLRGLDKRISQELEVRVRRADDPLAAVVHGAGRCLDDWDTYQSVLF